MYYVIICVMDKIYLKWCLIIKNEFSFVKISALSKVIEHPCVEENFYCLAWWEACMCGL